MVWVWVGVERERGVKGEGECRSGLSSPAGALRAFLFFFLHLMADVAGLAGQGIRLRFSLRSPHPLAHLCTPWLALHGVLAPHLFNVVSQ